MAESNTISSQSDSSPEPMIDLGFGASYRWVFNNKKFLHVCLDSREFGSRECIDTWLHEWTVISKSPLYKTPFITLSDLTNFDYSQHVYRQMQTSTRLSRGTRLKYSAVVVRPNVKSKLLKIAFEIMVQATHHEVENRMFFNLDEAMNWALEKYHSLE